jgi:hypothetical protein
MSGPAGLKSHFFNSSTITSELESGHLHLLVKDVNLLLLCDVG